MAAKKTENGKQRNTKHIAVSISKPVLSIATKLDQALDFAQAQLPLKDLASEQVTAALPVSEQRIAEDRIITDNAHPKISAWSLMPESSEVRQVLQARARIFSKQEQQRNLEVSEQYIRFRLGESALYGVPYANTEEILSATKLSRVPCTPPSIAGIVNYRGEMLTVIDLMEVFRIKCDQQQEKSWIIVVREGKLKAGLLVDEVDDNDEFASAHLSPSLDGNELVRGIHQGKVVILNISAIFTHPVLSIDEVVN